MIDPTSTSSRYEALKQKCLELARFVEELERVPERKPLSRLPVRNPLGGPDAIDGRQAETLRQFKQPEVEAKWDRREWRDDLPSSEAS